MSPLNYTEDTRKPSIKLLTLAFFGMGDGYGKSKRVTSRFYFNRFYMFFTTRNFRRQEIDGAQAFHFVA